MTDNADRIKELGRQWTLAKRSGLTDEAKALASEIRRLRKIEAIDKEEAEDAVWDRYAEMSAPRHYIEGVPGSEKDRARWEVGR